MPARFSAQCFIWLYFAELPANRLELSPSRRFEERGVGARDAREARGQRPYGPQGRNTDRSTVSTPLYSLESSVVLDRNKKSVLSDFAVVKLLRAWTFQHFFMNALPRLFFEAVQ